MDLELVRSREKLTLHVAKDQQIVDLARGAKAMKKMPTERVSYFETDNREWGSS